MREVLSEIARALGNDEIRFGYVRHQLFWDEHRLGQDGLPRGRPLHCRITEVYLTLRWC